MRAIGDAAADCMGDKKADMKRILVKSTIFMGASPSSKIDSLIDKLDLGHAAPGLVKAVAALALAMVKAEHSVGDPKWLSEPPAWMMDACIQSFSSLVRV